MGDRLRIFLTISCLFLIWISASASIPLSESLGIAPQDLSYYKSDVIKCKDGSKKFTKEQLNDEFCDCPDGTDEPGTSACSQGKFYCRNAGHIPLTVFSSRVNDGICDCCDGSDEYNGIVNCPNTCWEAGKVAREKLQKKIAMFQNGITIRKQEVEEAKQAFAKDEAELLKLKSEEKILKEIVQKLKEQKERIEKAEEEERKKKEEEIRLKEAERKANEAKKAFEESSHDSSDQAPEKLSELPNQDAMEDHHDSAIEEKSDYTAETEISDSQAVGKVANDHDDTIAKSGDETDDTIAKSGDETYDTNEESSFSHVEKQHLVGDQDSTMLKADTDDYTRSKEAPSSHVLEQGQVLDSTEGLSREELGRHVASRWTGENAAEEEDGVDTAKEQGHEHDEDIPEENHGGYNSYSDEDHNFDDDDFEDDPDMEFGDHEEPAGTDSSDENDKTDYSDLTSSGSSSWLDKIQQTFSNVFQAINFFKSPVNISEADTVRKKYEDSSSKLSKIQSRISSLSEKLKHDFGKDKEFYSFYDRCFETKQNKYVYKVCPFKKASQIEGHSTTQLGYWDKFEESYRVMLFSNGDRCWNGPDRTLKVRLRCGLKDELMDVDEPSRCEYVAILSTPGLCLEEKLKELQEKLEDVNASRPSIHDEL
ncbi:glucosidase 2 subunit beta-like isoform X2 [Phoenix dactylifera]|uniref:Glucosidase 2 subunit beta n=1 Tax=Phoenix dactylifera TaxID=42345 RepID=A0A8B9AQ05_PHODC|nr:glucosidase 2 subunit beta-like isoform X2 [Phoenix dactylifera]